MPLKAPLFPERVKGGVSLLFQFPQLHISQPPQGTVGALVYYRLYKTMTLEGREYNCYLFYKRTHTLDTKEMARLIDALCTPT